MPLIIRRYLMLLAAVTVVLVTAALLYYRSIQSSIWGEERVIMAEAKQAAGIAHVEEIYKVVWDAVLWVVQGTNDSGELTYVWLSDDGSVLQSVEAGQSVTAEEIQSQFAVSYPGAEVLRIQPAYLENAPAWEIFYTDNGKYHYAFYSFVDGTPMEQYHLTGKTAS